MLRPRRSARPVSEDAARIGGGETPADLPARDAIGGLVPQLCPVREFAKGGDAIAADAFA